MNTASNGLVMSEAWSLAWQELYSRVDVMSCHIRTLSPVLTPPTPPPPSSDLTDSRWQPPCFTKCWHSECHDTYLCSPLSCPTPDCQGRFWGRLMSAIWRTVSNRLRGKGQKGWRWRCLWERCEIEEDGMSSPSPPGGFHLQQQHF